MDNASFVNRIIARLFPNNVEKNYSMTITVKDVLIGELPELFVATEKDKPSPSGLLSHDEAYVKASKGFPMYKLSFVGWTNSMEPTFDYGDLVLEIPYSSYKKQRPLRIGEICTYTYGGGKIIHRFIGKTPEGLFIFKGDNNKRADPPVKEEQLVDVLVGIIFTNDKIRGGED